MSATTIDTLSHRTVQFEHLDEVVLPVIVERAWEKAMLKLTPKERDAYPLEQNDVEDAIKQLYNPELGWQDHLSK